MAAEYRGSKVRLNVEKYYFIFVYTTIFTKFCCLLRTAFRNDQKYSHFLSKYDVGLDMN